MVEELLRNFLTVRRRYSILLNEQSRYKEQARLMFEWRPEPIRKAKRGNGGLIDSTPGRCRKDQISINAKRIL